MSYPETDNHGEPQASALGWRRVFPGDDVQITMLRRWLECLLPPCPSRDDLMSVAVELGTNAVRHTASGSGGQFVAEVTWRMQTTRVAIYDDGSQNSPRLTEDLLCEDGRGLLMVNALSVRMGVEGNAQGKVVWADIPWTGPSLSSDSHHDLGTAVDHVVGFLSNGRDLIERLDRYFRAPQQGTRCAVATGEPFHDE
jgi:serine/threonine-protein kinase RsbW